MGREDGMGDRNHIFHPNISKFLATGPQSLRVWRGDGPGSLTAIRIELFNNFIMFN